MTRKEAAIIIKKYEKNGMAPLNQTNEYINAKQRWNEIVREGYLKRQKELDEMMKLVDGIN